MHSTGRGIGRTGDSTSPVENKLRERWVLLKRRAKSRKKWRASPRQPVNCFPETFRAALERELLAAHGDRGVDQTRGSPRPWPPVCFPAP